MNKHERGTGGEQSVARWIQKKRKMKILARNFRSPFGEIDLVASEGETIVFIEVKTRSVLTAGEPAEAVTLEKQRKIQKTALFFLGSRGMNVHYTDIRFDVASVIETNRARTCIRYLPGAFPGEGNFV